MASMNGITIKAVKNHRGHEGEACYEANLYLGSKRIGSWSQDEWGGPDRFFFNNDSSKERFKELVTAYYEKNPVVDELKLMKTEDSEVDYQNLPTTNYADSGMIEEYFMADLFHLHMMEKEYKRATKKGLTVMAVLDFYQGRHPIPYAIDDLCIGNRKEAVIGAFKETMEQYPYAFLTVYESPKDFQK